MNFVPKQSLRSQPLNISDTDQSQEETRIKISIQRLVVFIVSFIGSVSSMGLSFVGTTYNLERDGGSDFTTVGAALAISLVVAVFQLVGWWVLLDTQSYHCKWRKLGGATLTVAFLAFGYGTSSYFNYSSITAPSATIIYRSDQIDERVAELDALRIQVDVAQQLLPLVRGEKSAACSAAALERKSGIYSGSRGTGLVSGTLDGICQRATEAETALTNAVEANVRNATEAAQILEQLETALIATNEPILKRERFITALIRDLDEVIRKVRGSRITEATEAFFATLITSVAKLGPSGGGTFQGQQNAVLAVLRQGFEERLPVIEKLVDKIDAAEVPKPTLSNRPSVHEVMLYSLRDHPQNLLIALGIDSFTFFMILVFLLKEPPKRKAAADEAPVFADPSAATF